MQAVWDKCRLVKFQNSPHVTRQLVILWWILNSTRSFESRDRQKPFCFLCCFVWHKLFYFVRSLSRQDVMRLFKHAYIISSIHSTQSYHSVILHILLACGCFLVEEAFDFVRCLLGERVLFSLFPDQSWIRRHFSRALGLVSRKLKKRWKMKHYRGDWRPL